MNRCVIAFALALTACGHRGLTAPDGGPTQLISPRGYHIQATQEYLDWGGSVTSLHGELADRWWTELMTDLRSAGYTAEQTDPTRNVQWVFINLYKPVDGDSDIICCGYNVPVGATYDQFKPAFNVPGDYAKGPMLGRRPASQALKHEMLHHWCFRTLGHMCLEPGVSEWDGHHWYAPDGTDIWLLTWK